MLLSVGGQTGGRSLGIVDSDHAASELERKNAVATFEIQRGHSDALKSYYGYNYFFLSEAGHYPNVLPQGGSLKRREHMIYGGVIWQATSHIGFSPGIYLDYIDNQNPPDDEDEDNEIDSEEHVQDLIGKLAFPFEYAFSETARMTLKKE